MKKLTSLPLFALLLLGYDVASACTCLPPPSPAEALNSAQAIFAGEVTLSRERPATPVRNRRGRVVGYKRSWTLEVRFRVSRVWKGEIGSTATIDAPTHHMPCAHGFDKGERYLVYAYGAGAKLSAGICSRTKRLKDAQEDLRALGAGIPPPERTVLDRRQSRARAPKPNNGMHPTADT